MNRVLAGSAAFALAASIVGIPVASADPAPDCGPDYATALNEAIRHEKHDPRTYAPWNPAPIGGSNYDACADLSAVVVSIDNPRPTSPRQGFLFHRGRYIGTALPMSRPYTTLDAAASNPNTVVLVYTSGRTCSTCNDGKTYPVRYFWNGVTAVMADPNPPPQDWP
jgi:LppP/LprE lipoprotein